jgi:peptidyl-prolyl cis-trans isomerase SurA
MLEEKYPEYKALTREYRRRLLVFEVTNNEIWNKTSMDSVGIEKFFINRDKYKWEERAKLLHYTIKAANVEELNKIYEYAKGYSPEELQVEKVQRGQSVLYLSIG